MALIRDPAFWRRFSTAVHLDAASKELPSMTTTITSDASSTSPSLKHQDSWLARQQAKKRKRTYICWAFWIGFAAVVVGVVMLALWLEGSGILGKAEAGASATATPSPSPSSTPMAGQGGDGGGSAGGSGSGIGKRGLGGEGMVAYTYYG
ncbi:MAG: hypothetical protein M1820_004383 [Bogoriella megaspora]|nr:MAG: hypothetical protein M1820_004383 [Bogoriella megaspora]